MQRLLGPESSPNDSRQSEDKPTPRPRLRQSLQLLKPLITFRTHRVPSQKKMLFSPNLTPPKKKFAFHKFSNPTILYRLIVSVTNVVGYSEFTWCPVDSSLPYPPPSAASHISPKSPPPLHPAPNPHTPPATLSKPGWPAPEPPPRPFPAELDNYCHSTVLVHEMQFHNSPSSAPCDTNACRPLPLIVPQSAV